MTKKESKTLRMMISEFLTKHEMNETLLSSKLEISVSYLSRIISGQRNVSIKVARKFLSMMLDRDVQEHEIIEEIKLKEAVYNDQHEPLTNKQSSILANNFNLYNFFIDITELENGISKIDLNKMTITEQTYMKKLMDINLVDYDKETNLYSSTVKRFSLSPLEGFNRSIAILEENKKYLAYTDQIFGKLIYFDKSLTAEGYKQTKEAYKAFLSKLSDIEEKETLPENQGGVRINSCFAIFNETKKNEVKND